MWIRGLISELGIEQKIINAFCDSQNAIHLCQNQVFHERTKHIDVRLHFIRDIIENGVVRVMKIHTSKNPTDMLTKHVPVAKFNVYLDLLQVKEYREGNGKELY